MRNDVHGVAMATDIHEPISVETIQHVIDQSLFKIMECAKELELNPDFRYDMIDLSMLDAFMDRVSYMTRADYLSEKPYEIWQGKDGEWYTYLPNDKGGRSLKHRTTKEALENLIIQYVKDKKESPTVKDVFTEWLNKRMDREEIEQSTFSRYQREFDRDFQRIQNRKIKHITPIDIEDFVKDTIKEKGLSRKAFGNMRTLLYGIFKYAKKKGFVTFSIGMVIEDIEFSRKEFSRIQHEDAEQVFMLDEEKTMIEYLQSHDDMKNLGLLLLFMTGLRIGELCVLQNQDIDGCKIHINKTETIYKAKDGIHYDIKETPKTQAGVRTVILPDRYKWILDRIKRLNPFGEYLFMEHGKRIRSYQFRTRLYTNCKKLDIVVKSPHKVRKTYGTRLYDNNKIPKSLILQQMGHTDISCLEKHYYFNRMNESEKEKIINEIIAI